MPSVDCFVALPGRSGARETIAALERDPSVDSVTGVKTYLGRTKTLRAVAEKATAPYTLFYGAAGRLSLDPTALERLMATAEETGAALVYSDYHLETAGKDYAVPLVDYQEGSLRHQFDFGPLLLFRTEVLKEAVAQRKHPFRHAALYDLRLRASRTGGIKHVKETLYRVSGSPVLLERGRSLRLAGKALSYLLRVREIPQLEYEAALTEHLKAVGGYLESGRKELSLKDEGFPVEASVIIPCRNRASTLGDAIRSALNQRTDFPFNVLVVDDHSTDGSVDVIQSFREDGRVVYIPQGEGTHTVGDNLNTALRHPLCGRFAIQLDSDDLFSRRDAVRLLVEALRGRRCAMAVGSYRLTDARMHPLRFGRVDHREWTSGNGANNALRMDGLGAPRGYYVPVLRTIGFPDLSYGEDYAVELRLSREYGVARIYKVLYLYRRWSDNSDANLSREKENAYAYSKDLIRTQELQARIAMNQGKACP